MIVDEARAILESARELFGLGRWDDLFAVLVPVDEAGTLEGAEQGEVAFYLGEACLGLGRPADAVPYLQEAVALADVDFAAWAAEELHRARLAAADGAAANATASGDPASLLAAADAAYANHDAVSALSLYEQAYHGGAQGDDLARAALGIARCAAIGGRLDDARAYAEHAAAHGGGQVAADAGALIAWMDQQAPAVEIEPDSWQPEVPQLGGEPAAEAEVESTAVSLGDEIELSYKIPVKKSLGPVLVKELPVKFSGKLATSTGQYGSVTASGGTKKVVKLETAKLKWKVGEEWDGSLKGGVDLGSASGISGTVEITNGEVTFEVKFTLVKVDKGEVSVAEVTGSGGIKFDNEPVDVGGETLYLSGKATIGVTLTPNVAWFVEKGLLTAAEGAATTAATAAAAETIPTGMAAVGAAELLVTTGFLAGAVAQGYAFYKGMVEQEALEQLRTDADAAVASFAAGFASAWGAGSSPGGEWGDMGSAAGVRQFEADLAAFVAFQAEKHPGQTLDDATLEEVRALWRSTAAEKADAFQAVVVAMFGKMVRTAIYLRWRKANEDVSLGDVTPYALAYCGIPAGPSAGPDVRAAQDAARNANLQVNIDRWQEEWEKQYGQ